MAKAGKTITAKSREIIAEVFGIEVPAGKEKYLRGAVLQTAGGLFGGQRFLLRDGGNPDLHTPGSREAAAVLEKLGYPVQIQNIRATGDEYVYLDESAENARMAALLDRAADDLRKGKLTAPVR